MFIYLNVQRFISPYIQISIDFYMSRSFKDYDFKDSYSQDSDSKDSDSEDSDPKDSDYKDSDPKSSDSVMIFSVTKVTLHSQMSICLSVC